MESLKRSKSGVFAPKDSLNEFKDMVEAAKNDGNIEAVLEFIKDKGIR